MILSQLPCECTSDCRAIGSLNQIDGVLLSEETIVVLRQQPETAQGRRDRLIIDLLLDHGISVAVLAALLVNHVDLDRGELHLPQVGRNVAQRIHLTPTTLRSLSTYMLDDEFVPFGYLLQRSTGATLSDSGMSPRAIRRRIAVLGAHAGINGLTPECLQSYRLTPHNLK